MSNNNSFCEKATSPSSSPETSREFEKRLCKLGHNVSEENALMAVLVREACDRTTKLVAKLVWLHDKHLELHREDFQFDCSLVKTELSAIAMDLKDVATAIDFSSNSEILTSAKSRKE